MCLVLIGWRAHPEYRLIVAANRDEFYTRATEPMRRWPEVAGLVGGRDLGAAGRGPDDPPGTWLGFQEAQRSSRFATVTNVRNPQAERADARTRGALLMDFLDGEPIGPEKYLVDIAAAPDVYNGYNLMVSDLETLWWYSNRSTVAPQELTPGFHGLSNANFVASGGPSDQSPELTAPEPIWPKVRTGVDALRAVVDSDPADPERYFEVLADRTQAPDDQLPRTGVPLVLERESSARFIPHAIFGTRVSTVLLLREDGSFVMTERTFGRFGQRKDTVRFSGQVELPS